MHACARTCTHTHHTQVIEYQLTNTYYKIAHRRKKDLLKIICYVPENVYFGK